MGTAGHRRPALRDDLSGEVHDGDTVKIETKPDGSSLELKVKA